MEDSRKLFIPFRKKTNKLNRSKRISAARDFLQSEIFKLNFQDITSSPKLRPLRYSFIDEDDFEDFKQDLLDFRVLKKQELEAGGSSPECRRRKPRQNTAEARRSRLSSDQLMEFFNSDENFQEFERVFETFKSKRFSNSADKLRLSLNGFVDDDSDSSDDDDDKTVVMEEELFIGDLDDDPEEDMFSEFFHNDESFIEFEREFQTFKVKRRSRVIDRINRQSGCDIVSELQAICDRDPTKKYDAMLEVGEQRLWNSGGEWDYIFSHLNKNKSSSVSNISGTYGSCSSLDTVHTLSECDTGFYSEEQSVVNGSHSHSDCNRCLGSCSDISNHVHNCSQPSDLNNVPKCSCTEPCVQSSSHDCHFTSHQKCAQFVRLPCKSSPDGTPLEDSSHDLLGPGDVSVATHGATCEAPSETTTEKDETDSGYRSGTIPDDKLPRKPSQATLNREELKKKLEEYNSLVPGAEFILNTEKEETFQGFIKVTLNLVRPICMSLGARPPSIYELLTKEHIVEQNTQTISFYMPRDTVKSIHINSDETTKDVISMLLKKFHILDNPRKFALYEQELNEKGKIAKLRRIPEVEYPLHVSLHWEPDKVDRTRFVLQENENGEIDWEAFSLPELNNFLRVLDREESEYMTELKHKYKFMKKIVQTRLKELRIERQQAAGKKRDSYIQPAGPDHPLAQSS